jgi:excisionase family DNA binding protein
VYGHELLTADEVAERLGLHVRTVRNYIRDGQLRATRIGKQYRIGRTDLEEFTGRPITEPEPTGPRHVEVSSIVEIDVVSRAMADRLTTSLTSAANSRGTEAATLHVEAIHQPDRGRIKVVIVGDLTASAYLFGVINAIVEEPGS